MSLSKKKGFSIFPVTGCIKMPERGMKETKITPKSHWNLSCSRVFSQDGSHVPVCLCPDSPPAAPREGPSLSLPASEAADHAGR